MMSPRGLTAAVALLLLLQHSSGQTLEDCRNNLGPLQADNCNQCDAFYKSKKYLEFRPLCYNCLVNLKGSGQFLSDCWNPDDDAENTSNDVYNKCRTRRCFDCIVNFRQRSWDHVDLCKMVEPIYEDPVLRNLAFDCLSNTQGSSKANFFFKPKNSDKVKKYDYLRTSPCLQLKSDKKEDLDRKCETANCFYCLSNFANAPKETRWDSWDRCKACEDDPNFWGCVYKK